MGLSVGFFVGLGIAGFFDGTSEGGVSRRHFRGVVIARGLCPAEFEFRTIAIVRAMRLGLAIVPGLLQ